MDFRNERFLGNYFSQIGYLKSAC